MKKESMFSLYDGSTIYRIVDEDSGEISEFVSSEHVFYNPISHTEQAGYKPPKSQVMDFLNAGERLLAAERRGYYDTDVLSEDVDFIDLQLPKYRSSDYDLIDAHKALRNFNKKLDEYKLLVQQRHLDKLKSDQDKIAKYEHWLKTQANTSDSVDK